MITPPQLPEGLTPPTDEEAAAFQAWARENDILIAAQEQAAAEREATLATPISPLPIEGSTVAEVKASADIAIADLATQMQAKIDAILG
jgi:hypothetical protein